MADNSPPSGYRLGLLALSTELLDMIFGYLGMVEWKRLRLVNGELKNIATRYCFREVKFELNESSVKRLSDIAFHKELFLHVQHLVLRRARGLREFSNFNEWKESIILPGKSFLDFDEEIDEDIGDDYSTDGSLMSLREWSNMLDSEKEALYREYEIDRKNELSEIRGTTNHFSFRRLGCSRYARVHPERIPETITPPSPIQCFDEAVAKFTNLTTFQHRPSCYFDDAWATRWRRLRISGFAILEFTTCDEDDDVEALQLSYVLRALGWAKQFHQKLRSMSFYVCGPSFWGPDRLQCLWEGNGHQEIRASRDIYGTSLYSDPWDDAKERLLQSEHYFRQLFIMEHALVHLTHLDCSVSEEDVEGGLVAAAKHLFKFLSCAESLERLRLVFGRLVDCVLQPEDEFHEHGDGPSELLALFTKHAPWPNIRELELSIVTNEDSLVMFLSSLKASLRRLTLSAVTLQHSEGTWESALFHITEVLRLESLDFSVLCDYAPKKRILFDPDAKIWKSKKACYSHYKSLAVDSFLSGEPYLQDANAFLEWHSENCACK